MTGLTVTAVPSLAAKPERLPKELRVPEGHRLVLSALGRGVQIYGCNDGAWALREPAGQGEPAGNHFIQNRPN